MINYDNPRIMKGLSSQRRQLYTVLSEMARLVSNRMGSDVAQSSQVSLERCMSAYNDSDLRVTFVRGPDSFCASCDLAVRPDTFSLSKEICRDAETGDDFMVFSPRDVIVEVSWPSHGSGGLAVSLTRVALYRDVCELGCEIEASLARTGEMIVPFRTKAEREEKEQKKRDREREQAVHQMIDDVRKNMRINKSRSVMQELGRVWSDVFGLYDGMVFTREYPDGKVLKATVDGNTDSDQVVDIIVTRVK